MELSKKDQKIFDKAIKNPPKPNARLKKAQRNYKKFITEKDIDQSAIFAFLRTLNPTEQGFVTTCMNFAESMRNLIKRYNISQEEFCKAMNIEKRQYNQFICGAWNYTITHFSNFNYLSCTLHAEEEKKKNVVEVLKNK